MQNEARKKKKRERCSGRRGRGEGDEITAFYLTKLALRSVYGKMRNAKAPANVLADDGAVQNCNYGVP